MHVFDMDEFKNALKLGAELVGGRRTLHGRSGKHSGRSRRIRSYASTTGSLAIVPVGAIAVGIGPVPAQVRTKARRRSSPRPATVMMALMC